MPQVVFSKWCKSSVADRGLKRKSKYVSFQRAGKSVAYNSGFWVSCPVTSHMWEGQPPHLQQCNFNGQFFLFHFSHPEPKKYWRHFCQAHHWWFSTSTLIYALKDSFFMIYPSMLKLAPSLRAFCESLPHEHNFSQCWVGKLLSANS